MISSRLPEFDKTPTDVTVMAQQAIRLECKSKPPVVVPSVRDWRKDGKPLLEADIQSKRITSSRGQLLVQSARREDAGNYTCILINSFGPIQNSSWVVVNGELTLNFPSAF